MKNGRILMIAGLLIVLALFGYSHYTNKASTPASPEKETPVASTGRGIPIIMVGTFTGLITHMESFAE